RSRLAGFTSSSALRLRFFQWPIRSQYKVQAHPTPPSRNPSFRVGKRRVTPPMKMALHTASLAVAKGPMGLEVKVVGETRKPIPRDPVWKVGETPSSTHFAQTGS